MDANPQKPQAVKARFVTGSIMRHVVVMTLTSAIGLMAMFLVDLADLFFLSLLKQTEITAAIGYAGTLAFANLSVSIGTGIAAAALVARSLGAGQPEQAREFATSALMFSLIVSAGVTLLFGAGIGWLLDLLGAQGRAHHLARLFIWTLMPGFVFLAGAVACSFILRGLGDPRRAMYVTLLAAIITAICDPIFIFVFGWGIQGAAAANVLADLAAFLVGLHGVRSIHNFLGPIRFSGLSRDYRAIAAIAFPAMLTQLATPFANAYVTRAVAPFGDQAVAASAIIGRIIPVAFGIIFSLSGAVGPIIGQNFGAGAPDRVKRALTDGLLFSTVYTGLTSLLLFVLRDHIAEAFHAAGRTVDIVIFFCTFIAVSWAFTGAQFVAHAAFNNLGRPNLSTLFNWGKATLGTIPFALYGAMIGGPEGVLAGTAMGSVLFGIASTVWAYRIANGLKPGNVERWP
jgi:putative MATE family efflux protein